MPRKTAAPAQTARAVLLAELLDGELPDSDEYPASRARLARLIDDVLAEAASRVLALQIREPADDTEHAINDAIQLAARTVQAGGAE